MNRYIVVFLMLLFFLPQKTFAQEYVLPYPGFMPGHPLYKVSELIDNMQEWWSFGSFAQFKYQLGLADKKLVEAKTLFEYKQYLLASQALSDYEKYLTKAGFYLNRAAEENKNVTEKKRLFRSAISRHKELFERLNQDLPASFLWQPEKSESRKIEIREIISGAIKSGKELDIE